MMDAVTPSPLLLLREYGGVVKHIRRLFVRALHKSASIRAVDAVAVEGHEGAATGNGVAYHHDVAVVHHGAVEADHDLDPPKSTWTEASMPRDA